MKNSLLILAGAAALSLASCSQEKTTAVTTAPADGATTVTTTTTTGPMSDADIEARAQRIADKMAANMKITDEATKIKIRTVYVNRYKRMNEMRTKYGTDTTGMAASMRESNTSTDTEFKSVFTDPTQYQAYETSRTTYYADDNAPMDNASSAMPMSDTTGSMSSSNMSSTSTSVTTDNMSSSADINNTSVSKMKAKADDGSKIKVKENGKVKIKDADGTKVKN